MQKSVLLLCALIMGAGMLFAAEPRISKDGWDVGLKPDGFHIRRNGVVLTEGTMCSIVAGPQWKPVIDNAAFASAVRNGSVKEDGDRKLSVTVEKESSRGVLSVEILDAEKLRIAWTIDTDLPALADTTVWFLGLPQDDFALGSAGYAKDKSITLPCRAGEAETRKSLWRLTPDVKEMTITGKSGRLKVSGTYFHLFDARFHPFPPKMRTFCLRSAPVANKGTAEFTIEFEPTKELVPHAVTGSAAPFYLDCKGTLIPLRPGESELVFDLPPSDVPVLSVTGSDGKERRYTGIGGNVKFDFRKGDSALRIASASGTGGPFPVLADDSALLLAEAGRRLAGCNGKFPAAALEEEREQLRRLSADQAVPRTPAELAAKRQSCTALLRRLSCFAAAASGRSDVDAVALPSSARLVPGAEFPAPGKKLALRGAGGQTLFFQAAILPLGRKRGRIVVKPPRLDGVEFERVHLFEVLPVVVGNRLWPDMLEERNAFDFDREVVNVFVSAKLPAGAPAGNHRLTLDFEPENGERFSLEIPVKIDPFDLPEQPEMLTAASFAPADFRNDLPGADKGERERFLEYAAGHKLTLQFSMKHPRELDRFDWSPDPVQLQTWKAGGYLNLGCLPWIEWLTKYYYAIQPDAKFKSAAAYYAMAADRIAANAAETGVSAKTYFYYDEIGTEQKEVADMLRAVKKRTGLKLMTCFDKPQYGEKYVDYYRDLPDWMIFCSRYFETGRFRGMFDSLRKEGKKIGWYFNGSYPPLPSFNAVETPPAMQKAMVLCMIRDRIDCNLLWGLNCWGAEVSAKAPFPYRLPGGGNGYLAYPARDRKHFASSLRLEMLQEGIEAAQYFELLKKAAGTSPAASAALARLAELGELSKCVATPELLDDLMSQAGDVLSALAGKSEK